jgi:transcriptional regulator with XRE-family HTH domain
MKTVTIGRGDRAGPAIAAAIREMREARRWTQAQLGQRAGMRQQQVARLESATANPRAQTLERVAAALGEPIRVIWNGGVQ